MIQVGSMMACMTLMVLMASDTRPPALRITAGSVIPRQIEFVWKRHEI
jgi:hypothetical protein